MTVRCTWCGPAYPDLYYAYRDPAGDWSTPRTINGTIYASDDRYLISLDQSGNLHTVFRCSINSVGRVCYTNRSADGTWSMPENINNSANARIENMIVKDNIVHLTWNGDSLLTYIERSADGAWSVPEQVCIQCTDMLWPEMAVDRMGIVHLTWIDSPGNWVAYYAKRLGAGNWTPREAVAESCTYLSLKLDSQNQPHMLCDLYYTSRINGTGWIPVIELPQPDNHPNYVLSSKLLIDEDDRLHVIYPGGYIRSLDEVAGAHPTIFKAPARLTT